MRPGGRAFWTASSVTGGTGILAACLFGTATSPAAFTLSVALILVGAVFAGLMSWRLLGVPLANVERALTAARTVTADLDHPVRDAAAAIVQLSAELHGECEQLREGLSQKDEVLSSTVHELRTPLTTIVAALEILRGGQVEEIAERETFLEQAALAAEHMGFLINDLLDAAALDADRLRMDIERCDAGELLHRIRSTMAPQAAARGITLDIPVPEPPVAVLGDQGRVLQVLFNLVSNAIKYSPEGSEVRVDVAATDLGAVFEIVDAGIGVSVEARRRLFTRYSRVHTAEASTARGTGLGLYLSKTLVERMGGSIGYAERTDGPGSVFWFTLPVAEDAAARAT